MRFERRAVLFTFLVIILFTGITAVLALLGFFPNADPQFGPWVMGGLLVEIVGWVVGLLKLRPSAERVFVNILFPDNVEPQNIQLDDKNCTYEIKDKDGEVKSHGSCMPTLGPGGFQCRLSSDVNPSDYVKLSLVEKHGRKWEVPYFSPYVTNQNAIQRN